MIDFWIDFEFFFSILKIVFSIFEYVEGILANLIDMSGYIAIYRDISRYIAIFQDISWDIAIYRYKIGQFCKKKIAKTRYISTKMGTIYPWHIEIYLDMSGKQRYIMKYWDISRIFCIRYIERYQLAIYHPVYMNISRYIINKFIILI